MTPAPPDRIRTQVDGHTMTLSNLGKVLYPETGFTKAEVVDYYAKVAPVLLPRLTDRPATRKRWPDGVEGSAFFEKNAPRGTPDWVRTVTLPTPGSSKGNDVTDFVVVDDTATLIWLANLAALELHVPQWRVGPRGGVREPDLVVVDLDPGLPAGLVECCQVALMLREALAADGLRAWAKTSGSKGLQMYVPIRPTSGERTTDYAKAHATALARRHPDLVVARMAKQERTGKVFLDWSQNNPAKTTVAAYSLRGRSRPTVSTPVTWEEVEACRAPDDLTFEAYEVLDRLDHHGDLLAELDDVDQALPR